MCWGVKCAGEKCPQVAKCSREQSVHQPPHYDGQESKSFNQVLTTTTIAIVLEFQCTTILGSLGCPRPLV